MRLIKPLRSLLVKPAGPDCNLNCEYCFYLRKNEMFCHSNKRMSLETLEEMIRQALTDNPCPEVSFGWQGGEPTLMGLDFYKKAVSFQKKYARGKSVGNGFQTNGILIRDDWARFFSEYSFLIGLSLDGPEEIHDRYRKNKLGRGTWNQVMKSLEVMLKHNVAVNALAVVNDISVQYPEKLYRFYKDNGLNFMQFIPCLEKTPHTNEIAPFCASPEALGDFWCRLFDCWLNDFGMDGPETSIRFFDSVFYHYVGLEPPECVLLKTCGIYEVVEHNGQVYSCDFFVEPSWKLGDLHRDNLIELLNSKRQKTFGQIKNALPSDCLSCPWLHFCRGGCPKDRINRMNYFCEAYKRFFEYSNKRYIELAEDWLKKHGRAVEMNEVPAAPNKNSPCPCGSGLKYKHCCGK